MKRELFNYTKQYKFMKQKLLTTMLAVACLSSSSFAQTREVSGKVTAADGKPVSGASISVVGSTAATQSDASGNFKLSVPSGASLSVSSIGYVTQRVSIGNSSILSIVLASDDKALDEVVVTAMGIKRSEKSLGYSATTIGGENLAESRNTNVVNAIAGKVAGVTVNSSGPSPGAAASVTIRGYGSVTGSNEPLYVVDGVPYSLQILIHKEPLFKGGGFRV